MDDVAIGGQLKTYLSDHIPYLQGDALWYMNNVLENLYLKPPRSLSSSYSSSTSSTTTAIPP